MISASRYTSYSKAFFNFVKFNNSLDKVYNDAMHIEKTIKLNLKLKAFLQNRHTNIKDKINLLKSIFNDISSEMQQLLKVVAINKRLPFLDYILSEFINLYYKEKKITKVDIILASQVDKKIIDSLKNKIAQNLNDKILTNINISKKLIGGFIISFGSKTYDASIANSLNVIKSKLLENS